MHPMQPLTSASERLVNELRDLGEMQGDVLLGHVQQLQALVLDVVGGVVGLAGVHRAVPYPLVALGGVEDMGDPQAPEVGGVPRRAPGHARQHKLKQHQQCQHILSEKITNIVKLAPF